MWLLFQPRHVENVRKKIRNWIDFMINANRQIVLQIKLKQMFIRLKLKISHKNVWYFIQNNLHAFVRQWASPSDIFSHSLQNLMLKSLHFFPLPD